MVKDKKGPVYDQVYRLFFCNDIHLYTQIIVKEQWKIVFKMLKTTDLLTIYC